MPIFAGAATATPPVRTRERDGDRRTFWFSSRLRLRSRLGRSPRSQCRPDPAPTAANAEAANPPPAAVRAHAGRRPQSGHRRGYDRRVRSNGERRARGRTRRGAAARRAVPRPRPRQPARAAPRPRSPPPPGPRAKAGGTAVDAGNSTGVLTRWRILCRLGWLRAERSLGVGDRRGEPSRPPARRQQRRLADRLARRRSLPPVRLSGSASKPLPLPTAAGSLRAPLLTHELDGASRGLDRQRLGTVRDGSTGHRPRSSRRASSRRRLSSGPRHRRGEPSSDVPSGRGRRIEAEPSATSRHVFLRDAETPPSRVSTYLLPESPRLHHEVAEQSSSPTSSARPWTDC